MLHCKILPMTCDVENRETLNTMGYLNELNNRGSLLSIIEKLPYHLKTRWLKEVHRIKTIKKRTPNIDDVTKFITTAAEEVRDPVFGKIVQRSSIRKELKLKDTKRNNGRANFGIQTSSTKTPDVKPSVGTPTKTATPCPCCGQLHYLNQCDAFKAMRIKDRLALVQSKRLCVNCFKPGHLGRDCTRHFVCAVQGCGKKHSKYLHLPLPRSDTSCTPTSNQSTPNGASSPSQTTATGMQRHWGRRG